jgi:virulence-associated protein VapD
VRSLDLPDQPDEAGRPVQADAGGADRPTPKSRDMPDPDERGRAYEAVLANVSAETRQWAEQDRRPDGAEQGRYWSELPRLREMWADHERRWPERQHAVDRSHDPAGSYRSDGGFYLNPEQHAEASESIRRVRETEQPISADMQAIAKENTHGGWLEGFKHCIKGDDRLKEKIAEQRGAESDESAADVLRRIPDAVRYTYCFERENYVGGYYDIKARLESFGYELYQSTNYWTDPEYKGINTRWVTQQGQRFEVQFHTPESFHAKHDVTHIAYERIRDTTTSRAEKRELHEFQKQVSALIEVPEGATDIPNYRKEGF